MHLPLGPFTCVTIMCLTISKIFLRNATNEWIIYDIMWMIALDKPAIAITISLTRIRVGQQWTNGKQHLGDCQCRRPIVLEDIQANGALAIDVAVINASSECDLSSLSIRSSCNHNNIIPIFLTLGGLNGYSSGKWTSKKKIPPW